MSKEEVKIDSPEGTRVIDLTPVHAFRNQLIQEAPSRKSVENCRWYLDQAQEMSQEQLCYLVNELVCEYERMTDLCRSFGESYLGIDPFKKFGDMPFDQMLQVFQKLKTLEATQVSLNA